MSDILVSTVHHMGDVHLRVMVNGEEKANVRLTERQRLNFAEADCEARLYKLAKVYDPMGRPCDTEAP